MAHGGGATGVVCEGEVQSVSQRPEEKGGGCFNGETYSGPAIAADSKERITRERVTEYSQSPYSGFNLLQYRTVVVNQLQSQKS